MPFSMKKMRKNTVFERFSPCKLLGFFEKHPDFRFYGNHLRGYTAVRNWLPEGFDLAAISFVL